MEAQSETKAKTNNLENLHNIQSFFSDPDTEAETDSDSGTDSICDAASAVGSETDAESISDWLNEQRELEADYNEFYPEIPTSIQLYFLYINKNNELQRLGKETHILENYGKVNKDSLHSIIQKRKTDNNTAYKLCHILKYNITATPREILKNEISDDMCNIYFTEINTLKSIIFSETICVLQDLNTLFVVLKEIQESDSTPNSVSKKTTSHLKSTRRIKFKKKTHSTRRKRA